MGRIFKIACNRKGAMLNQRKIEMSERKQLRIFLSVAFVLPYLMGILMGYAYNRGIDVSFFPNAQMYYPAAGIMWQKKRTGWFREDFISSLSQLRQ